MQLEKIMVSNLRDEPNTRRTRNISDDIETNLRKIQGNRWNKSHRIEQFDRPIKNYMKGAGRLVLTTSRFVFDAHHICR